jgi:serine/threonine protein kinase
MELQHIGRYDIKSMIGQGGMSAVYLGYDPRSQREVAIKILPPYYLHSPKFRERFEREALMIALLEHPAIVPVYDMGEEDGQPYIVMRYMSGGSLGDKLKKGPIPLRECMEMYFRLAPALDTAHARGVTHRDVKPDNLLFDKYDNVFLSDFGLARLRETIGFANISDGTIMGTPAYMSPEQIQGDRQIDGRSDIYSMGVVLYQMLCGEVPFSGTTAASVMMMHLVNPIPQIREVNKTLPTGIQAILDIAMAKKPDDRYQSAGEFAKAIQAVTTGVHRKPVMQPVTSAPQRYRPAMTPAAQQPSAEVPSRSAAASSAPAKGNGRPASPAASTRGGESSSAGSARKPATATTGRVPLLKRRFIIPLWGWIAGISLVLLVTLAVILWWQGWLPFLSPSGSLLKPNQPQLVDTQISQAIETDTISSTVPGSLGKADKLAFVSDSDIWASDLDGNNLIQLTTDGESKSNLNWTPDGQSVIYTAGNCIKLVGLQTQEVITKTCIDSSDPIKAFDISPASQLVALGLGQTSLYLLPYAQLFSLPGHSQPTDIQSIASCTYFSPYDTGNELKTVSWSMAGDRLAMLLSTPVDGVPRDEVSIVDFSQCTAEPARIKEILPTHFLFTLRDYFNHPEISSVSWNAEDQLILNGYVNGGFGDLQLYNLDQDASQTLTPNGDCCYRDARWSPDGSYVLYTYQPEAGGEVSLYYVPAEALNQPGENLASKASPVVIFTGSQGSVQPALRSVHQ